MLKLQILLVHKSQRKISLKRVQIFDSRLFPASIFLVCKFPQLVSQLVPSEVGSEVDFELEKGLNLQSGKSVAESGRSHM